MISANEILSIKDKARQMAQQNAVQPFEKVSKEETDSISTAAAQQKNTKALADTLSPEASKVPTGTTQPTAGTKSWQDLAASVRANRPTLDPNAEKRAKKQMTLNTLGNVLVMLNDMIHVGKGGLAERRDFSKTNQPLRDLEAEKQSVAAAQQKWAQDYQGLMQLIQKREDELTDAERKYIQETLPRLRREEAELGLQSQKFKHQQEMDRIGAQQSQERIGLEKQREQRIAQGQEADRQLAYQRLSTDKTTKREPNILTARGAVYVPRDISAPVLSHIYQEMAEKDSEMRAMRDLSESEKQQRMRALLISNPEVARRFMELTGHEEATEPTPEPPKPMQNPMVESQRRSLEQAATQVPEGWWTQDRFQRRVGELKASGVTDTQQIKNILKEEGWPI